MQAPVKVSIGIDVSMDSLEVRFGLLMSDQVEKFPAAATFANTAAGFRKLERWAQSHGVPKGVPVWFVMEATGVYYEKLAYHLTGRGHKVAVVLPTKLKHYVKTLDGKSKTDKLDARGIAQFGLERPLTPWEPPSAQLRRLKELSREHETIQEHATQVKNQLHAKDHSQAPGEATLARLEAQLALFKAQLKEIEREMHALVERDPDLHGRITNVMTAEGLGFITVVRVVAETYGFAMIRNQKQLTSYAGYDVALRESGTRKGQPAISKKGNSHLRAAVYMPALVAIRHNKHLKEVFLRLVRNRGNKMIAVIAVARKLLCLIYTLWKSQVPYDPNYLSAQTA